MTTVFQKALDQGKPLVLTPRIHEGDIDLAILLRVHDVSENFFDPLTQKTPPASDLSAAILPGDLKMRFTKPDNVDGTPNDPVQVDAGFATVAPPLPGQTGDGLDGLMEFRTPDAAFLDIPGFWKLQGIVKLPPGDIATQEVTFRVHPRLSTP